MVVVVLSGLHLQLTSVSLQLFGNVWLAPALPVVGVADENIDFIFKVGSDFVKITFSRSGLRYNLGPR